MSGPRPNCPQLCRVQISLLRRLAFKSSIDRGASHETLHLSPVAGETKVISSRYSGRVLQVVNAGQLMHHAGKRRVSGHVGNPLAVQPNLAPVLQRLNVPGLVMAPGPVEVFRAISFLLGEPFMSICEWKPGRIGTPAAADDRWCGLELQRHLAPGSGAGQTGLKRSSTPVSRG